MRQALPMHAFNQHVLVFSTLHGMVKAAVKTETHTLPPLPALLNSIDKVKDNSGPKTSSSLEENSDWLCLSEKALLNRRSSPVRVLFLFKFVCSLGLL